MNYVESSGGTKISVVVPVYNEKGAIRKCLEALLSQDYPKENYEVVVVNDSSTDGTKEIVESYPVRLINFNRNRGRIIAREIGARVAKYDMLYFVDARIIPDEGVLSTFVRIAYQPNIGGEEYLDKYRSLFDTFFYIIRRKIYKPYYPQFLYEEGAEYYYIDETNFDETPKGMSSVFISKELFLSAIPEDKGKMINDDTRLLREIIKQKKILRHSDVKITYLQRTGFWEVMRHIYERGPRFADYYLKKGGNYRKPYLIALICLPTLIFAGAFNTGFLWYLILFMSAASVFCSIWLAENVKDFIVAFLLLPPVMFAFSLGILKWQSKWH